MKDSFIANQLRGMHSSGLFVVEKDGTISSHKKAVCGQEFIEDPESKLLLNKVGSSRIAVGHVRHATVGGKTDENAHPFLVTREDGTKLIGVHNGTLRNWKFKEGSEDIDVDSRWAFSMLAEHGTEAFTRFDGAFAFVWYDSRTPDVLYMARNEQRPLHYMVSKNKRSIIGASELGMLGWLTERNELDGHKDAAERFRYLKAGKIYKFDLKNPTSFTVEDTPAYDPNTTISVPVTTNAVPYRRYRNSGWYGYVNELDNYYDEYGLTPSSYDKNNELYLERVLREAKEALADVRADRFAKEATRKATALDDTSQETLDQIKQEILRQRKPESMSFLGTPMDGTATKSEIGAAKHQQTYGALVPFVGILYDESTSSLLGSIDINIHGTWVNMDAELRGVPRAWAEHKYIKSVKPEQVAVIGWNPNMGAGMPAYYVVAELTETQKNLLLQQEKKTVNN